MVSIPEILGRHPVQAGFLQATVKAVKQVGAPEKQAEDMHFPGMRRGACPRNTCRGNFLPPGLQLVLHPGPPGQGTPGLGPPDRTFIPLQETRQPLAIGVSFYRIGKVFD